mmetsp:Transcript_54011/g.106635  ORF Transcript_54011/g.106635 Transcript_54011/m.106635 type:complete len:85 (+) Transcript_54011:109-363(+)
MDGASAADIERTAELLQMQTIVAGQKVTMKILGHCFDRCIATPGDTLAYQEQQCIWNCTQRLFDSEQFLVRRLQEAQKQKQAMG